MRKRWSAPLWIAALSLGACGPGEVSDEGFTQDPATRQAVVEEADRFAIESVGREVKLGLTEEVVYLRLSDSMLARTDREMARDVNDAEGIGATIAKRVTGGVSQMLRNRIQWSVDEIRDIRYEGGELKLEMEDGSTTSAIDSESGSKEAFDPAQMERFIQAFRDLKAGRAGAR